MKASRLCLLQRAFPAILIAGTVATIVFACKPPMAGQTAHDDSGVADAYAAMAEREVLQLREGVTLAKWLEGDGKLPGWNKTPDKPVQSTEWPGPECTSYVRTDTLPSGVQSTRAVYFYPPPPPSPAIFPTLSADKLIGTCVLAAVRIEAAIPISDFGPAGERIARIAEFSRAADQAVQARFTKRYGESIGRKRVDFWGRGYGKATARWISEAEIVAGHSDRGGFCGYGDPLVDGPSIFVCAGLPLAKEFAHSGRVPGDRTHEAADFSRALAATGVEPALSARMQHLYEVDKALGEQLDKQVEEMCDSNCPQTPEQLPRPTGDDWSAPLVPLLQDWFVTLRSLGPGQRAAGLLAADRLLRVFSGVRPYNHFGKKQSSTPAQTRLRQELQRLGARFEVDYGDGAYSYSGSWLEQAKQLAPDREGGRLALLTWMSAPATCGIAGGGENFRKVISEGEALLAKKVDPSTAAQIHFMVGDAYSDIYAIARGIDPNGDFPQIGEADAGPAHTKALEHYRLGLVIDNQSAEAKRAWRQAWQLSVAHLPDLRYACFSD